MSADASKNEYENNNSITSATKISPSYDGKSKPSSYSKFIYATLHRNERLWGLIKREIDEDYYRFDVYGKANVSIKLYNIPNDCDYDIELYEHDNVKYCEEGDATKKDRSFNAGQSEERITWTLFPGVYYVRVLSYKGFNAQEKYTLSVNVSYKTEDVSIPELKYNKGVGAAIWISDFDPFGMQAFESISASEVGYFSADTITAYKIGYPLFGYLQSDDPIEHATLYIWNKELRQALYKIVLQMIKITENEISDRENIRFIFDTTEEIIDGNTTIISMLLTIASAINTTLSFTEASLITTIAPGILKAVFNSFFPSKLIAEKQNYLHYLEILAVALKCNQNTSDNEVIRISSKYSITNKSAPGLVFMSYAIDFTPVVEHSYLYSDDTLYAFHESGKFNGTIYPLKSEDDIDRARNKNQITLPNVNTGGDTEITLLENKAASLNKNEYHWYHFTAPENGVYRFYTNSDIDTYGELFPSIVEAQSTKGQIKYGDDTTLDDGSYDRDFAIDYSMYRGRIVYIRVSGFSVNVSGNYSFGVKKISNLELTTQQMKKEDFGFTNEYVDQPTYSNNILENGFMFSTNRLRCGFINGEYLALSAKRKYAGFAYLEINFYREIYSFDFDIAIWSNEEYLNSNSAIVMETLNENGTWNVYHTFDISSMSKTKDMLDSYTFVFETKVTGLRISVSTNKVNYEKNKGRVVLDNIDVKY